MRGSMAAAKVGIRRNQGIIRTLLNITWPMIKAGKSIDTRPGHSRI